MPPVSPKVVNGKIDSVPCPHCGQGNDFREIEEELAVAGSMGAGADRGQRVTCDHCQRDMEVVQIQKTVIVATRQWPHG